MLLHPVGQHVPGDPQVRRGLADVAALHLQHPLDHPRLEVDQREAVLGQRAEQLARRCLRGLQVGRRRRQVLDPQRVPAAQDHRPLARVGQLAHVARPAAARQLVVHGGRHLEVTALGEAGHEVSDQRGDVLPPLAQRRQRQLDDVQAIQQIAAQRPLGGAGVDVLVGGRQHAHVDRDRGVAADDVDHVLLQHPQQLALQRQRQLGDLVEEQGPAGGLAEASRPIADRPGERPAHVPEQLRLEQLAGDRRAVDRDEGPLRPPAAGVDPPRDQLFAGAALAGDQHRRRAAGHAIGDLERAGHRRRRVHDRPLDARRLAPQRLDLLAHAAPLERLVHGHHQMIAMKWFAEEVERAGLHRRDRHLDVAIRGDHQHRRLRGSLLDAAQHLHAADAGHLQVGDHEGVTLRREACEPGLAIGRAVDRVAGLAEIEEPELAARVVVLDEQDRLARHDSAAWYAGPRGQAPAGILTRPRMRCALRARGARTNHGIRGE